MEEINNVDILIADIRENNFICKSKTINLSHSEFRKVLKMNTKFRDLKFQGCNFNLIENDDRINQIQVDNSLSFINCDFESEFKIENIVFNNDKISFIKCQFKGNIEITDLCQSNTYPFNFLFEFSKCKFHNVIVSFYRIRNNPNTAICFNFSENENENEFLFEDINKLELTHFSYEVLNKLSFFRIESLKLNLSSVISTFEIEETNLVSIRDDFQISNFVFDKSQILGSLVPNSSYEIQSIKSTNTDFKKIIDFSKYFINEIYFEDCEFKETVLLIKCKLKNINFINCSFEKSVKIIDCIEKIKSLSFQRSTIKRYLHFNSLSNKYIEFEENANIDFTYIRVESTGHVILRSINYKENSFHGNLNFQNANILGILTIEDSKFYSLNLKKSTIEGQIHIEDIEVIDYLNRDTLVKIKHEYLKKNDKVKALEFQAMEYEQYIHEIDDPFLKKIRLILNIRPKFIGKFVLICLLPFLILLSLLPLKKIEKTKEFTLLYFNKISNSFGINWAKGVTFTMLTAFIFYVIMNYCGTNSQFFELGWIDWKSFGEVWKGFLNILNIFNFNNQKFEMDLNAFGETLFFLSKIFIAFGVYQTIAAFRKYGK